MKNLKMRIIYSLLTQVNKPRHDTRHDNIQHYDTQRNDTQHNDTQLNDTQYNDTQHSGLICINGTQQSHSA